MRGFGQNLPNPIEIFNTRPGTQAVKHEACSIASHRLFVNHVNQSWLCSTHRPN